MLAALRSRAPVQSIRQFSTSAPALKVLYVGNLSWSIKEDELRSNFEQFGELTSAKIIMDRLSGRARGFGFVEFADDAAADAAIEQMNGKELDGRALTVNESVPREPREFSDRGGERRSSSYGDRRGGGGGGGGYGGRGGGDRDRFGGDRRPARGGREEY